MRLRAWTGGLVLVILGLLGCTPDAGPDAPETSRTYPGHVADPPGRRDSFDEDFPPFEPFRLTGSGDGLVALPDGVWAGTVSVARAEDGPFAVWETDSSGVPISTLVNSAKAYSGTTAFGLNGRENTASLAVRAEGPWALEIASVRDAPELPSEGVGDGVFWNHRTGSVTWRVPGDEVFRLTAYTDYAWPELRDTLIPGVSVAEVERGVRVERPVRLTDLDALLVVRVVGPWSLS